MAYPISYEIKGVEYSLKELQYIVKIPYQTLYNRIVVRGMSVEEAISKPYRGKIGKYTLGRGDD
jgi:hypothetical protein